MTAATDAHTDGFDWLKRSAPILSLMGVVAAAVIGAIATVTVQRMQSDTATQVQAMQKLSDQTIQAMKTQTDQQALEQHDRQINLDQQRFDQEKADRQNQILQTTVPKLVSSKQSDRDEALAVLFAIYPNEAHSILDRVNAGVSKEQKASLTEATQAAQTVNAITGTWLILASSNTTLERAQTSARDAEKKGFQAIQIFHRSDSTPPHRQWYATTIGHFDSQTEAERTVIAVRAQLARDALVKNLTDWCPNATSTGDYLQCP